MTHNELIRSMKETLIKMCHSHATLDVMAYKVNRNNYEDKLVHKAVYVLSLDRSLTRLEKESE